MSIATPRNKRSVPEVSSLEARTLFAAIVGLAGPNSLVVFDSATPTAVLHRVKVKGLTRGEALLGIDFRPSTGQLYGVGSTSRLYRIDPTNGTATAIGAAPFAPPLAGTKFGVDFNPVEDHLRIVSDADANLRLDPVTGAVIDASDNIAGIQTDLSLAYAQGDGSFGVNPAIEAIAHSSNIAGASATTVFGIDTEMRTLVRIGSAGGSPTSPDTGTVTTIGPLGDPLGGPAGLDIDNRDGVQTAMAVLADTKGDSGLYTLNLTTGAATFVGAAKFGKVPISDIAIVPQGKRVLLLDAKGRLRTIDSNLPNVPLAKVTIGGLQPKEAVIAMDVRPSSGVIYGFTNQNRLVEINADTGAAAAVGTATQKALRPGFLAGMDFNPVSEAIRMVSLARENVRISAGTGQMIDADPAFDGAFFDGPLGYASTDANWASNAAVSAIAHDTNVAGASATTVYAIDARLGVLATLGSPGGTTPPTSGQLFTVGSLKTTVGTPVGFDIVTTAGVNRGFATFGAKGKGVSLFNIDLNTGEATPIGNVEKAYVPIAIAVR